MKHATVLPTESDDDPSATRRRLLNDILRVARADAALFYVQARDGGRLMVLPNFEALDPRGGLSSTVGNMNAYLREKPAAALDPTRVRPIETEQFVEASTLFGSWQQFAERPMSQWVLQRTGLADQIRLLAFDDDRYLGWIGAFRRLDAPRFGLSDRRALATLVPRCIQGLAAADRQERAGLDATSPVFVVVSAEGGVEHMSDGAHAWLRLPSFREALAATVNLHRDADSATISTYIRHATARLTRLDGQGSTRFLVSLELPPMVRRVPSAVLSPTQERVARLLADGLKRREVAATLGLGEETVRSHAREIYRRLGVSDRLELVRALSSGANEP